MAINPLAMRLSPFGDKIVRKGGHDDISDDDLLFLEIVKRAPGMSRDEYQQCFVAIRMQYHGDALRAIQTGHVVFEERPAGERVDEEKQ